MFADEAECNVDSIELLVAIDEALTSIREATGKMADVIVVVPPGTLAEGVGSTSLSNRHGKCLLVSGYSADLGSRGVDIAEAIGEVQC